MTRKFSAERNSVQLAFRRLHFSLWRIRGKGNNMTGNFSDLFKQTTDRSNTTVKPLEVELCPGVSNARFANLDSSAPNFVNASLNAPLAIATTFANLLVLLALRHVTSIRLPYKLLLCSLVLADLGAGLVVQSQYAMLLLAEAIYYPGLVHCALFKSVAFNGLLFSKASLCTLTAIGLDRYTALFFYLKYQQIVTTRRVCVVLASIWSLTMFAALTSLWNFNLWFRLAISVSVVNFPIISLVCIKIYRRSRAHKVQYEAPNQTQQQAGNTLNMERYRRTASTVILVYVLFLICNVPFGCLFSAVAAAGYTPLITCFWEFAYTLELLNSLLKPFVYCLRLPEIRTEVTKQLRKLRCRSSLQ